MNILFIGDIYGKPGVDYLIEKINFLKKKYKTNIVIANSENVSNGKGLDYQNYQNLILSGVNLITMGNHAFRDKTLKSFINQTDIIRPLNFEQNVSGYGYKIIKSQNKKILVMNALGRVFMENPNLSCPFREIDKTLLICKKKYDYSFLDFHAQTTSEKMALGYYFDGRIDAIVGTHTHVQTNDERLLPKKTLYISDVGMTGPFESVIGQNKNISINNFINNKKIKNKIASGRRQLNGVCLTLGKNKKIQKIKIHE